jgi:2-amino-4-hydroxy-6-hydroxymethyldihydropteridine diphosphokinase
MAEKAYVGIGSNLGDRRAYLEAGFTELTAVPGIQLDAVSSVYETAPIGYTNQPFFLNAVFSIQTCIAPEELLQILLQIEKKHHRQRSIHWGPRTLDLDLLLYGERRLDTAQLKLPHPQITERCFVLAPLCEIAPNLCHPCSGKPFRSYYLKLGCTQQLRIAGHLHLVPAH